MARIRLGALAAALCALAGAARAQEFREITDRDYTLDLHQGAVLGSGRIIGMGGTAVATGEGSPGAQFNPAAAAVRDATATGTWDWDVYLDYLSSSIGSDFDNNGVEEHTDSAFLDGPVVTFGGALRYEQWGASLGLLYYKQPLEEVEDGREIEARTGIARFAVARELRGAGVTIGGGFRTGVFQMDGVDKEDDREIDRTRLFEITGTSLEAGAVWRPEWLDLRAGLAGSLPVSSEDVTVAKCDPLDCEGLVLPERAALAWQASAGVAWRRAATRWNRAVPARWRDEKYWLFAGDLVLLGHVPHGYGIDALTRNQWQPSGRDVGVSPRFGVEVEWIPGWLRLRAGTYWEPSRFRDEAGDDIPGRQHITTGIDVRVWTFCLWRERYRLRLSATSDGAQGYGNGGLSIGFWH